MHLKSPAAPPFILIAVIATLLAIVIIAVPDCGKREKIENEMVEMPKIVHIEKPEPVVLGAVRPAPDTFPRDTWLPKKTEGEASGSNVPRTFSPGRDLIYFDDTRVWWKSDNRAANDTSEECSHTMHKSMIDPFTRLVNLVSETQWILKVQGCYSAESGVHSSNTLHKQGRAIDLTFGDPDNPSEKLDSQRMNAAYEQLAKLAWQAGFDWVYYEHKKGTGPHIHASVRIERDLPPAKIR